MLGLERGSRVGENMEPPYFPEEDDMPPARDPGVPPSYAKAIGTIAGRDVNCFVVFILVVVFIPVSRSSLERERTNPSADSGC